MTRYRSFAPSTGAFIAVSKENEKSEPFSNWKQVRIFLVWWMWLTIVLSFGFYLPVVLWADVNPLIGMLMIPKTCAYVWTVLIGYNAMKAENGRNN